MKSQKKTHFGHALICAIGAEETTQFSIAQRAGITHPTLSRMISKGFRPEPESLKGVCNAFQKRTTGADVLCGHLCDEIERAGYIQSEIQVRRTGTDIEPGDIERWADRIAAVARRPSRTDVRDLLAALAVVCEGLDDSEETMLHVAEKTLPENEYVTNDKNTNKNTVKIIKNSHCISYRDRL